MEHNKWYQGLVMVIVIILLAGCGKQKLSQEIEEETTQEASMRKIGDISAASDSAVSILKEMKSGTGQMVFDNLSVTMDFPDGWLVDSRVDSEYQGIYGIELSKSLHFDADEISKELFDGKMGESMSDNDGKKKLKAYIKEDITYEVYENYKSWKSRVWQNPTYESIMINGQEYIKVSGVTKSKRDSDAHVGYFTIVNGVILQFVFDSEAAVIDQATQSIFDTIMNSITYTY